MTARVKRGLSIVVLVAAVAAAVATFLVSMSTGADAPSHEIAVIGDPTIADGPTVMAGRLDAVGESLSVASAVGAGTTVAGRVPIMRQEIS